MGLSRRAGALLACVLAQAAPSSGCVSSDTTFCMKVDPFLGETGYFTVEGFSGPSPELTLRIGQTYTFDQTDHSNWYHAIGFAFVPDGAHGLTWGGAEQPEVESPYLSYKINGESPTGSCAPLGLDCYEPQFFWPKSAWSANNYTAELNVTEELAEASHGGEIYYFCHIHSRMSGRMRIANADGSPLNTSALANPSPNALYSPVASSSFDLNCGTFQASDYATGGSAQCATSLVPGALDTDFKKCLDAIDCKMVKEMRVLGHDSHASAIATFMQQMIPHHVNAINVARLLLKLAPTAVAAVEDLADILWDIIVTQGYQIHAFRNWLGGHAPYLAIADPDQTGQTGTDANLTAESVGHHCNATLPGGTDLTIPVSTAPTGAVSANVAGCTASDTTVCVKVNLVAGESGYYEFAGKVGPSPEITAKVGDTILFDQRDPSNWYHPIGFAYYPDGAHGEDWGGDERAEVEAAGELLYLIDGLNTTCPDAGDTGLDCYEPEFFYPRADWLAKTYSAELTITQAMLERSHGGVIYYFCHIHSKMSGKIRLLQADGSAVNTAALQNPSQLPLYQPIMRAGADLTCGTTHASDYAGGGSMVCTENFLCGMLDTTFEKCMQAIDCKMSRDMLSMTASDTSDMVAMFMQQMIPHHLNAVNMAKILLTTETPANIDAAMEDDELTHILNSIINSQNYQVHQFRNYLGGIGYYTTTNTTTTTTDTATTSTQTTTTLTTTMTATTPEVMITEALSTTTMAATTTELTDTTLLVASMASPVPISVPVCVSVSVSVFVSVWGLLWMA